MFNARRGLRAQSTPMIDEAMPVAAAMLFSMRAFASLNALSHLRDVAPRMRMIDAADGRGCAFYPRAVLAADMQHDIA